MRKAEGKKIDAFEMWWWRRVMSVVDGEKNQRMGARKHHAGVDTGIEGVTSICKILCRAYLW